MSLTTSYPTYTIVSLQGHLNAANATELAAQLTTAVQAPEAPMVFVDMKEAESLDSAGLMALVSALRLAQQIGRKFVLCSVSPAIRIIFELTQLDRVFEMLDQVPASELVAA